MAEIADFFVSIGSKFDDTGVKKAEGMFKGFVVTLGDVINIGNKVLSWGKMLVVSAGEQERAELTLAQAMKQAGTYTKEALDHSIKYATSLQSMTEYGDEAIIGVQKMLTNFGVEGEMLDRLTKATLDLAAAKGMDLTAAADLVAKSVGSTTNALTRYGIAVEGDVGSTKRMQMAVDNISKLFGGAAQANANTFLGRIEVMKNRVSDLYEAFGKTLLPILESLFNYISSNILPALENFMSKEENVKKISEVLGNTFKWTIKIILGVKDAFVLVGDAIANTARMELGMFTLNMHLIKESVAGFKKMGDKVKEYGKQFADLENLKVEKTAETEQAITDIMAVQTEARTEIKDVESENNINRANVEATILKEMEDAKLAEEEARALARKTMADDVAMTMVRGLRLVADVEVLTWRTGVKAFGEALKERLNFFIYAQTQELIAAKVVALAKAIFNSTTTWGAAAWQIGAIVGQFGAALGALKAIESFDKGGIVPGFIGQPQLAIVHGGETVIPPGSGASTINVYLPAITSRTEARRMGDIVGNEIVKKIKRSRRV